MFKSLIAQRWTPAVLLDEPELPSALEALWRIEARVKVYFFLICMFAVFILKVKDGGCLAFARALVAALPASDPPIDAVIFCVKVGSAAPEGALPQLPALINHLGRVNSFKAAEALRSIGKPPYIQE